MWEIDLDEMVELWRGNRAEILKWLESKVPYGVPDAHVLPNGQSIYYDSFTLEAMDISNFEAVYHHFRFLGIDLDQHTGGYHVQLPLIFDENDLELGAICAFFWYLDDYIARVYPLLNEDHFYELIYEEQQRRASEDAENYETVDQWLSNYNNGYDLSYTGYGHGIGDIPEDYVRELAMGLGLADWRELAHQDRINYYDYYGLDY